MADEVLADLVTATNHGGASGVAITLLVGGHILSGTLISYGAWTQRYTLALARLSAGEEVEAGLLQLGGEASASTMDDREHIHLSDVRLHAAGGGALRLAGTASWRGRLDAVSGWMLGAPAG